MSDIQTEIQEDAIKREVVLATLEDMPGILDILHANLLSHKENTPKSELESGGFLVHGYTEEELRSYINDPNHVVLVLKEDNDIIGYTLGYHYSYNRSTYSYKEEPAEEVEEIFTSKKVFYYRHIAKKKNKKNVGSTLLKSLEEKIKDKGYEYIICHVSLEPIRNNASLAFHDKLGFKQVASNKFNHLIYATFLKKLI